MFPDEVNRTNEGRVSIEEKCMIGFVENRCPWFSDFCFLFYNIFLQSEYLIVYWLFIDYLSIIYWLFIDY